MGKKHKYTQVLPSGMKITVTGQPEGLLNFTETGVGVSEVTRLRQRYDYLVEQRGKIQRELDEIWKHLEELGVRP